MGPAARSRHRRRPRTVGFMSLLFAVLCLLWGVVFTDRDYLAQDGIPGSVGADQWFNRVVAASGFAALAAVGFLFGLAGLVLDRPWRRKWPSATGLLIVLLAVLVFVWRFAQAR